MTRHLGGRDGGVGLGHVDAVVGQDAVDGGAIQRPFGHQGVIDGQILALLMRGQGGAGGVL